MPPLEVRRLAVAAALDALSREPLPARAEPPQPVEDTLKQLAAQIGEVLARLDSVETALLESVWDREPVAPSTVAPSAVVPTSPAAAPADAAPERPVTPGRPILPAATAFPAEDAGANDDRLSVPAVPLTDVRMSNRAAKALFGE